MLWVLISNLVAIRINMRTSLFSYNYTANSFHFDPTLWVCIIIQINSSKNLSPCTLPFIIGKIFLSFRTHLLWNTNDISSRENIYAKSAYKGRNKKIFSYEISEPSVWSLKNLERYSVSPGASLFFVSPLRVNLSEGHLQPAKFELNINFCQCVTQGEEDHRELQQVWRRVGILTHGGAKKNEKMRILS